ncbi:MAG TPA: BTAD domain-containing putative transcriptional regulator [Streptosporangiaceae bacterium]|nr:BTAD domain-containing putative transcriptional regulator [Streptosporangiaceae bacterium]
MALSSTQPGATVPLLSLRSAPAPPSALNGEMVRDRLTSLLAGRFDRPVTALVAGPGFGKTTLLAQAVRQNLAGPVGIDAWVSCQPDDEEPGEFAAACCRAIGLQQPGSAGTGTDVLAVMRWLSPLDVCLIVDDVHQIAGSPAERLLAQIVRGLPSNGHVVLSGRVPPGVPLARLRATGGCVEISEPDLAFTAAEEREMARLLGVPVPSGELAGWPALVRLALTSQRTVAHQFLWEEIVSGLQPAEARALLALALAGWADERTLSAMCGTPVSTSALFAKVPLLTMTDGGTVRAHDLWTESLERLYPYAQIAELLPAVRDTLLARGDALRLVALASRLRDPALIRVAARELVGYSLAALPVHRARSLLAATAPDDREAPELLLLRAAIAHAVSISDPAIDPLLAQATAAFRAAGDETGEAVALVLAGRVASTRGAYTDFLQIALRVAELPTARDDPVLRAVSELVTATMAELNGDLDGALEALGRLPAPGTLASDPIREPAARLQVYMLVLAGRADEAVPIADAVLRTAANAHVRTTPPFVRWSAGDPSELTELRTAPGIAPETNARDKFYYAALSCYVRASVGDTGALHVLAGLLKNIAVNRADPRDTAMLAAADAVRLVALHDEAGARQALADQLEQFPITDPRCDVQLRRALATVYICAPAVRAAWDAAPLGPCHRRTHAVAQVFLAAREIAGRDPGPGPAVLASTGDAITAVLADTDALVTMLPLPFSVELAVRAHGHGLSAGLRAVELLRRLVGGNVTGELRWLRDHGEDELSRRAAGELLSGGNGPVSRVRVEVLGPTRVFIGGRLVDSALARRARVRQLLALLAAEPDLRRDRAMTLLWPELDQAAASRNLRVTLTYLRQVLQSPRMLLVDSSAIRLVALPGLDVDLWLLDAQLAAAARARDAGDQAGHAAALAAAAALWHGEPLADLADLEELTGTVTRVRTALTDAVLLLGEVRLSDGLAAESVRCAQTVLTEDPYNERAHRLAVATQLHLGDHQAARDAATRMTAALADAGAAPSETSRILLRRIAATGARR